MKVFISKILNSKLLTTILILAFVFTLMSWGVSTYLGLKTEIKTQQQNQAALLDTLRVTKNKVGELEYSKKILVVKNNSDLKELNRELSDITKKFTGRIHELSQLIAQIKRDTTIIKNTTLVNLPGNVKGFKWSSEEVFDENNSRTIAGVTKFKFDSITKNLIPLETLITEDRVRFNIIQGLRTTKDGKVEMFASSNYPDFSASDLNSVIIDPKSHPSLTQFTKPKRFKLGVYGGFGTTLNLSNSTMMFGPQLGVGVSYTFW